MPSGFPIANPQHYTVKSFLDDIGLQQYLQNRIG